MPFTISGAKYASTTLSAAGTTTATIAAATFVSGDFSSPRIVGLWNSGGTVFKGLAWVRRFVSTTQLQLVTEFFDPATGIAATQVVGDVILVSKNFSESVVAGLAVSGPTVTITDVADFGTASSSSVCFYDEDKLINTNSRINFVGGLTVFGKLEDYGTNFVSSPVNVYSTLGTQLALLVANGANSNFAMYGGSITGVGPVQYLGGNLGITGNTMIFNSVQNSFDFTSPGGGGSWGATSSRQQLINCYSVSTATNAILVRWGDGVIRGGSYKFPNFTSAPLSVFGSDAVGTYTVSAIPGDRLVVLDMGNGNSLTRSATPVAITFNFTNLISTNFNFLNATGPGFNANGTNTVSFSDQYTDLQVNSIGVVLNSSGVVVASQLMTGTTWEPALLRRTVVGGTTTINSTSWTFGVKKYGFGVQSGTITPTTYNLGTAGSADNVSFGGSLLQTADANVTLSEAAALALSSKITAASGSPGSITVTANATIDEIYDYLIAWGSSSVALAQFPSLSSYPISASGTAVSTSMDLIVNTGVVLSAGAKFNRFNTTGTVSFVGTGTTTAVYQSVAGVSARLEISGIPTNGAVYVENGAGVQQGYQIVTGGSYALNIAPGATGTWRWVVKLQGYEQASSTFTPGSGGIFTNTVSLSQKLLPDGSPMYQGTSSVLCAVSFSGLTNAFIDIGNGTVSLQAAFDESEDALVTAAGMGWLASGKSDTSQFNSPAGDFFFMTTGWRLRRAAPADANATIEAFVQSSDGTPVDEVNGPVRFFTSDSPTAIASAVVALMNASPPNVNVTLMNSADVIGTGTTGDAWRGIGVLP